MMMKYLAILPDQVNSSRQRARAVSSHDLSEKDRYRFFIKIEIGDNDDCWFWVAAKNRKDGYGQFKLNGQQHQAHRISYALCHGSAPENLFICHRCDVSLCVNPHHLWVGTAADNSHDCISKMRHRNGQESEEWLREAALRVQSRHRWRVKLREIRRQVQ